MDIDEMVYQEACEIAQKMFHEEYDVLTHEQQVCIWSEAERTVRDTLAIRAELICEEVKSAYNS